MALKDILVHIDSSRHSSARLEAATGLAAVHGAHLIGLHIVTRPAIPNYVRTMIPDEVMEKQAVAARDAARLAQENFEEGVRRADVRGEWRSVEGPVVPTLGLHARYADLVIVGQREPNGDDGDDGKMPDQLILSAGRPVLIVPYAGHYPSIGERVLVAWDASRLACRAVNDALPLLTRARHVVVLSVDPKGGDEGHGEIPSADICLHLARHGVDAEAQQDRADDIGVGALLLSRAAEQGCDLIVCGAYGHARWRELVLGGVTRHLLAHMTMPVLMSH